MKDFTLIRQPQGTVLEEENSSLGHPFPEILFTILSYQGIWLQFKASCLLLHMTSDLGLIHMVPVLEMCTMWELWGHLQQKIWEVRHCACDRTMCEAVRIKLKSAWKPHKVGKVRIMEHLRKITRREQSWPKREATVATSSSSAIGTGSFRPFGNHGFVSAAQHGATELSICTAGFQTCVIVPLVYSLWDGNYHPMHVRLFLFYL